MTVMNEFVWPLHKPGYEVRHPQDSQVSGSKTTLIIDAFDQDMLCAPWIAPAEPRNRTVKRWRPNTPLRSKTALFRTFGDLDCSEASIVDFADKYGLLTDPENGESLETWKVSSAEMRSAVESVIVVR